MAITFVQAGQGASTSVTLSGAPAQGNLLIAVAVNNGSPPSAGSGWTQIDQLNSTQDGISCWKIAGAGESATQTPISGTGSNVSIYEFNSTFGWPANPINVHSTKQAASLTPPSVVSTAVTPTQPSNGIVGVFFNATNADTAPSSVSGMTVQLTLSGGATGNGVGCYQLGYTGGSFTKSAAWTGSTASAACAFIVVFNENTEISLVQSAEGDATSSVNLGANPIQGNLMVAVCFKATSPPTASAGWTTLATVSSAPNSILVAKFAGAGELTLQQPSTNGTQLFFMEFSSASGWPATIAGAIPFSVGVHAAGAAPPSVSTGALTIGGNNYYLGLVCLANNVANTAPASITSMVNIATLVGTASIGNGLAAWQWPVIATTSKTCSWTGGSSIASTVFAWTMAPASYPEVVSGSVTGAGAVGRFIASLRTGSITDAGVALRAIVKNGLAGAFTASGTAKKATLKLLTAASVSLAGVATTMRSFGKTISASISATGTRGVSALTKLASGSMTLAGAALKQAQKKHLGNSNTIGPTGANSVVTEDSIIGHIRPIGLRVPTIISTFRAGAISATGSAKNALSKLVSGSIAAISAANQSVRKNLSMASLAVAGDKASSFLKSIPASIAATAQKNVAVQTLLAGTVSATGAVNRLTEIVRAGSIVLAGSIGTFYTLSINATISAVASIPKQAEKAYTATVSGTGVYGKAVNVVRAASVGIVAATNNVISKVTSGALTPAGQFGQRFLKTIAATLAPLGTATLRTAKAFIAQIAPSGAGSTGSKIFFLSANASIAIAATYKKMAGKNVRANVMARGLVKKSIAKLIAAIITVIDKLVYNGFAKQQVFLTLSPVTAINLVGYGIATAENLSLPVVSKIQLSLAPPGA